MIALNTLTVPLTVPISPEVYPILPPTSISIVRNEFVVNAPEINNNLPFTVNAFAKLTPAVLFTVV